MSEEMDTSLTTDVVEQVQEQTNFFIEFWSELDWQGIAVLLLYKAVQLLLIVLVLWVIKKIGTYLIETAFKKYISNRVAMPNRYQTLYNVSMNMFHAVLWFFFIYAILSLLGVPVGTLLAGAGVIGLALSLGAQGFVSDVVNGFFILLEKQADVGDTVIINELTGTVQDVNLKTTRLVDFDGTLHFIPNREITIISNLSRENMRARVIIPLSSDTDFDRVKEILFAEIEELVPNFPEITKIPEEIYIVPMGGGGGLAAQITFYTIPDEQWGIQWEFNQRLVAALQREGIKVPNPIRKEDFMMQ